MTTVLDRTAPAAKSSTIKPPTLPRSKPVSVNGTVISRAEIARETQNHPAEKPVDAWTAAARALVVRELLLQEARRLAMAPCPITDDEGRRETDEEALIRQLVDREVRTPEPDRETCQRVYERNRARFRSTDLSEVRHILVAAPRGDDAARATARRDAEAILAAVQADMSSFSRLAASRSACPSARQGGSLGQIGRGQTVPEFEAALGPLDGPGLVESRYGFHVVIVDRRIPGRELPFEMVAERIANWLKSRSQETAIRQYITMLAGRAEVAGVDLAAASSPLVQ
jgi:peptidyl-prolyl cis-trans isomerase C